MEKIDYRFFLLIGLILVFTVIASFLLAYAFIYVIANYGALVLILAFLGLALLFYLYKKYKKNETQPSQ